jgi:hypothetical protein
MYPSLVEDVWRKKIILTLIRCALGESESPDQIGKIISYVVRMVKG